MTININDILAGRQARYGTFEGHSGAAHFRR